MKLSEQGTEARGMGRGQIMQDFKAKFTRLDYFVNVTESLYQLEKDNDSVARIFLVNLLNHWRSR